MMILKRQDINAMNAIIDTNIVIDAIVAREPFKEISQNIIRSVSKKNSMEPLLQVRLPTFITLRINI